jgi:hypothetical protein
VSQRILFGIALDYNTNILDVVAWSDVLALEDRTARLTILIDPRKKALFESLCAEEDATPSQVVRRLIRGYIEERTGRPWVPSAEGTPEPIDRERPRRRSG